MKRKLLLWFLPPLGAAFIKLLYLTCKKRFHLPSFIPEEPFVIVFWHGELLMQSFLYRKIRCEHKVAVMISEHFDGELIARTNSYFGIDAVRGSSKRGGAKALIGALRLLKNGYDVAITPDGPRGPRRSVAGGVVTLAKKADAYILPFSYAPTRYWKLDSWDGFIIPKPFSRIDFFVGDPLKITSVDDNEAKALIKRRLLEINKID